VLPSCFMPALSAHRQWQFKDIRNLNLNEQLREYKCNSNVRARTWN
jgi:hypothetical protein